ncbi:unnamed protein product, partial [Mesorhabditis spiculigera]
MTEPFVECADDGNGYLVEKQFLTGNKYKWTIMERIGDGGYGSVYKVKNEAGQEAALKLERRDNRRKRMKLEMETMVLKEMHEFIKTLSPPPDEHFTVIYDRAKKENFGFYVMGLVGESLQDLRKARRPSVFSLGTAYALSISTLQPIELMHRAGFLHRDIKPANYAIGLQDRRRVVYILDFGIARKYLKSDGSSMKTPREKVGFKGTIRYASLASHSQKELGPKDDVESWLYMCVDFANPDGCLWKGMKAKEMVVHSKTVSRTPDGKKRLFQGMDHKEWTLIMDYTDSREVIDRFDYEYPKKLIQRAAKNAKLDLNAPYDWESTAPATVLLTAKPLARQDSKERNNNKTKNRKTFTQTVSKMVSIQQNTPDGARSTERKGTRASREPSTG